MALLVFESWLPLVQNGRTHSLYFRSGLYFRIYGMSMRLRRTVHQCRSRTVQDFSAASFCSGLSRRCRSGVPGVFCHI